MTQGSHTNIQIDFNDENDVIYRLNLKDNSTIIIALEQAIQRYDEQGYIDSKTLQHTQEILDKLKDFGNYNY